METSCSAYFTPVCRQTLCRYPYQETPEAQVTSRLFRILALMGLGLPYWRCCDVKVTLNCLRFSFVLTKSSIVAVTGTRVIIPFASEPALFLLCGASRGHRRQQSEEEKMEVCGVGRGGPRSLIMRALPRSLSRDRKDGRLLIGVPIIIPPR
jgi:hypothetical protein